MNVTDTQGYQYRYTVQPITAAYPPHAYSAQPKSITMAGNNTTPYYLQGNVRLSLTSYIGERRVASAPPCCAANVTGGGHDWTYRNSGHAAYIDYHQSAVPTPRTSRAVPTPENAANLDGDSAADGDSAVPIPPNSTSTPPPEYAADSSSERSSLDSNDQLLLPQPESAPNTDENSISASIEPLSLPPPAYSATPRASENTPFREYPPTYDQVIRADRFHCVRWVPGLGRLARPETRALNEAELAQIGVYVGTPVPRRTIILQFIVAPFKGDLTWLLLAMFGMAVLLGVILAKTL